MFSEHLHFAHSQTRPLLREAYYNGLAYAYKCLLKLHTESKDEAENMLPLK
jgi:hypothetical protein